jgi:hypothetical protein
LYARLSFRPYSGRGREQARELPIAALFRDLEAWSPVFVLISPYK